MSETFTTVADLGVTPFQIANLTKLAKFLAALPADYDNFHMGYFFSGISGTGRRELLAARKIVTDCGSVACAVGHGPAAGVAIPRGVDNWNSYGARSFGLGKGLYDEKGRDAWVWCFADAWAPLDNTPAGAAKRIRVMLSRGVSSNFGEPSKKWLESYNQAEV